MPQSAYQRLLIALIVLFISSTVSSAQTKRSGTWAASNASGKTFVGTWTATPDSTGNSVVGTWTLGDPRSAPVASGVWSAAKAATQWNGAWRAVITGRTGEYSGTWNTGVELNGSATFADLFEKAVDAALNGTWQMKEQSGAWSIRAAKKEGVS